MRRCLGLRPHGDVQIVAFLLQPTREPCWSLPSFPEVFGINEGTQPLRYGELLLVMCCCGDTPYSRLYSRLNCERL